MNTMTPELNVVYFSLNYPELSQTFVFNEMRSLRDQGARVRVVALRHAEIGTSDLPEKYGFSNAVDFVLSPGVRPPRSRRVLQAARAMMECDASFGATLRAGSRNRIDGLRDIPFSLKLKMAAKLQPKGQKPVIHCHFGTAGRLVADLKRLGLGTARLSVVFHGYDITQYMQDKPADIYRDLFEQADLLLPISDLWHRRLIELGAAPEKIRTQRLGIDCSAFRFKERAKRPEETLRFISVGRMTEKKGHRYVLEAFARLVTSRPDLDIRLDLIGSGPLFDDISALADRCQLGDRLVLHGSLRHDEVRALLDEAHVFVLPSVTATDGDMEGIPVAIMEAMAMGLAVISTHHSGIPELVADGKSGLLVPERDVEALSTAMQALATSSERIASMGREGREIIEESYNEEKQAKKLFAALSGIR
ncbi:colanic acid biosynthesis glycosyltransferase WcaL [Rhizobium phaseoli]|uniref:glycosyltransferase n=1 Tax=Rhizobium phaseoli TaxID=396 RepID=UPI000F88A301|nr:glycosyltransferase [Rhizobium phaseoli]RUM14918.1 colanic acid biosynthesis glycosyltransferase WcaL [Rhizobium phaseoli]